MGRSNRTRRRDTTDYNPIARQSLPFDFLKDRPFSLPSVLTPHRSLLQDFEDRREWHPEPFTRPARSFTQPRHRLSVATPSRSRSTPLNRDRFARLRNPFNSLPARIAFRQPDKVLVCVRRSIRREVLHALRKNGKRGQRSPRFTQYSQISCRR